MKSSLRIARFPPRSRGLAVGCAWHVIMGLLDIPIELRAAIFSLVLTLPESILIFQESGTRTVNIFTAKRPTRWLALLTTCTALHDEAAAVLFGTNTFHIMDGGGTRPDVLASFLDTVGPAHTARLKHLRMSFPVAASSSSRVILRQLRERCTALSTLELILQRTLLGFLMVGDDEVRIRQALMLVNEEFTSISSLNRIVVLLHSKIPPPLITFMKELGWVVADRG